MYQLEDKETQRCMMGNDLRLQTFSVLLFLMFTSFVSSESGCCDWSKRVLTLQTELLLNERRGRKTSIPKPHLPYPWQRWPSEPEETETETKRGSVPATVPESNSSTFQGFPAPDS